MATLPPISPCLWFDNEAEQAAQHYVSIFPGSAIELISHYGSEGFERHGRPAGSVMVVSFRLSGTPFTALNGGPRFKFTEAISLQVMCETQAEIDHFWDKLSAGGSPGPCGWLKDRYGLSWQVVPTLVPKLMTDADPRRADRAMKEIMQMGKIEIARLESI